MLDGLRSMPYSIKDHTGPVVQLHVLEDETKSTLFLAGVDSMCTFMQFDLVVSVRGD